MRKQKLKIYLKFGILLFGISLFIISCQKDDDLKATEYNQEKSQFKISYVGKAEIENNNLLNSKLNELTTDIKKAKINTQNKTVYSSEYDFYINTDYATYLENDDASYHSYTFNIIRSEEINGIENLVFSINSDNSYNTSIVKYNVSSSEKELIFDGHYIDLTNKISSIAIENNFNMVDIFSKADGDPVCISTDWQAGNECPYAPGHTVSNFINDNGSICSWVQAGNTLYAGSYVSSVVPCFNGFSGGDGINNTGNNSPNGTSSNGTNGQTSNGGSNSNGTVITSTTGPCRGPNCPEEYDPIHDENCDELHNFSTSPYAQNEFSNLETQIGATKEKGYVIKANPTFPYFTTDYIESSSDCNEISIPSNNALIYSVMHTHPTGCGNGTQPMFGPGDLHSLYKMTQNYNSSLVPNVPFNNSIFTVYMTVAGNHYAIKIKDISKLNTLGGIFTSRRDKKDFLKDFERAYDKASSNTTPTQDQLAVAFLKFINNTYNLGISLYRTTHDDVQHIPNVPGEPPVEQTSNWKQLILDQNNNLDYKNC